MIAAGDAAAISTAQARKVGTQNVYTADGFLQKIVNAQLPTDTYFEILETNERGQVIEDRRAGNTKLDRTMSFDGATGRLLGIKSGLNNSLQNLDYGIGNAAAGYDQLGNLQFRKDLRTNLSETFTYDSLNRITGSTVQDATGKSQTSLFTYDAFGNFKTKGNQTHVYGAYTGASGCARTAIGPNMLGVMTLNSVATRYCFDLNGNQISAGTSAGLARSITYAVHDKPLTVTTSQPNASFTRYRYGSGREIVTREEGSFASAIQSLTHYVGGMEVTYRGTGSAEKREYRRYLSNFLVVTMNFEQISGAAQKTSMRRYRFEEKLGSLDVLADDQGNAVQRLSFDLWGQRRDASWGVWNTSQIASFNNSETRKGYTGHEMLDAANLIHMGGRMYDPLTGRFLSADILVQAPYLSQSHNRYSYVMNNPMNYVDPTGYAWLDQNWRTVASVAISFYLPGVLNGVVSKLLSKVITGMISGGIQSGSLKGALTGGLGAAMFHGIGNHFDNLKSGAGVMGTGLKASQLAQKIGAHAMAGGVLSVLNGGKFGHGFASAGVVEALNPAIAVNIKSDQGQFIANVIVGGTASVIAGGKFANGAVTAAFQMAFNHEKSSEASSDEERTMGIHSSSKTASEGANPADGHAWIGIYDGRGSLLVTYSSYIDNHKDIELGDGKLSGTDVYKNIEKNRNTAAVNSFYVKLSDSQKASFELALTKNFEYSLEKNNCATWVAKIVMSTLPGSSATVSDFTPPWFLFDSPRSLSKQIKVWEGELGKTSPSKPYSFEQKKK